jgi:ABC-type cobalamin/Fe3+-siderophores transport system ATPase subunit
LHQQSIQRALGRVHDETNTAIVTVTHDVNAALSYHSHLLALVDGRAYYCGPSEPNRDTAAELLARVYGIPFEPATTAGGSRTLIVPEALP